MDKRTLEKYEREARDKNRETWYLSWALDTNQEERDKVSGGGGAKDCVCHHLHRYLLNYNSFVCLLLKLYTCN